jgi:hypothetical protein
MPAADAGNNKANCTKEIFQGLFDAVFEIGGVMWGAAISFIT